MIATNHFDQRLVLIASTFALLALASCTSQDDEQERSSLNTGRAPVSSRKKSSEGVESMKSATRGIAVTSTAFGNGEPIPTKYTEDGEDLSPALAWNDAPTGTKQWALICDDPDAPTDEPWVHWVIYGLLATVHSLPEGVKTSAQLSEPKGTKQGKNSWPSGRTVGYRGPAPPKGHGVHHYHFKLYALDSDSKLGPGLTKSALLKAIDGHILGVGELVGTYQRK
jgi:Raf kinase inhibitor-like YbhB/YbcL family protein